MKKKYNFTVLYCHQNPSSEEVCIRNNIRMMFQEQTDFIHKSLRTGTFSYDDIRNLPKMVPCIKCSEEHPVQFEEYQWFSFDLSKRLLKKLKKSKVVYLHNNNGTWFGHHVAYELLNEVVLEVADALYN